MKDGDALTEQQVMVPDGNTPTGDYAPLPQMEKLLTTVKSVTLKVYTKTDEKTKETTVSERANFCFALESEKGRCVWGSVPYHEKPNPKTKLYEWASLILGTEKISSYNDLLGRQVSVMVKDSKRVNPKTGKPYQNVVELFTVEQETTSKAASDAVDDIDKVLEEEVVPDTSEEKAESAPVKSDDPSDYPF